ncbi:MAG: aminotransferase class V-fold PLP-dependent enzyme [Verrucomicrobia bacterium]|nr:aminotransferase class V-fold PLP-dependent enzyme [Verrucomicrobiota bacterium]
MRLKFPTKKSQSLVTSVPTQSVWPLDPAVTFLNHGSFGSCPLPVLEFQRELRERMERQPVKFFVRDLEGLLDEARAELAAFVGSAAEDLVFVPNATSGVNAVLRALDFQPGDELLVTDHEYNACRNALDFVAQRSGERVVVVKVPFPVPATCSRRPEVSSASERRLEVAGTGGGAAEIIGPILAAVTPRTKLALLDHVTSQTGLVLPIEFLVRELNARNVDTLVDGAHAPGMVPLDLHALNAAYYTGNCHKWICAPKGAAFLHVRADRQKHIRPLVISHGANSQRTDRSRFLIEFGWMGTGDPSAALSVPKAIEVVGSMRPGGWKEVMRHNRDLALTARRVLCKALNVPLPCPDELIGSLAAVPIPDAKSAKPSKNPLYLDPLQDELLAKFSIEVPVIPWPAPPNRLLRISAQLYNSLPQYEKLAGALKRLL